jgi:ATP-dependent helicase/nuclease subunit B
VLRLRALDPLDQDPGAAERGSAVHRALHRFVCEFPEVLPAAALDRLLAIGRAEFGALLDRPGFRAFWWPWFERVARQFIAVERRRRGDWTPLRTEVHGRLELAAAAGPFTLTAIADRIDRGRDGALDVIDYKTGAVPSSREVALGLAPQLPLEAALARAGGFADVPACDEVQTGYWPLRRDAGGPKPLHDAARLADAAMAGLQALIAAFDAAETPYLCCPRPSQAPRFNDYELLARRPEWAAVGMDLT